jgi:multidrug resistance efflux pump
MKKRNIIIIAIIIVALIGGGGIMYYYNYQNSHYISTDDAQVTADMVTVTPQINGAIKSWRAKVGETVTKGQVLGTQETDTMLSSTVSQLTTPQAQQAESTLLASKADIKSPIDGKVIQYSAVNGQMVSTSTSVAVVADTDDASITANIKEVDISGIKAGQTVTIDMDAYQGKNFTGKVESIGQAAESVFSLLSTENTSGNYTKVTQLIPVKISIDNQNGCDLMPGMNASVKIDILYGQETAGALAQIWS